jgi:2-dehydropantoate 2-reductase
LAREAAAVAAALGIALPYRDPVARVVEVARATALNRSSMLADLEAGRGTEIDAINGEIVRLGRLLGVAVPENQRALDEVRRAAGA